MNFHLKLLGIGFAILMAGLMSWRMQATFAQSTGRAIVLDASERQALNRLSEGLTPENKKLLEKWFTTPGNTVMPSHIQINEDGSWFINRYQHLKPGDPIQGVNGLTEGYAEFDMLSPQPVTSDQPAGPVPTQAEAFEKNGYYFGGGRFVPTRPEDKLFLELSKSKKNLSGPPHATTDANTGQQIMDPRTGKPW
jgi:hypothetical protein